MQITVVIHNSLVSPSDGTLNGAPCQRSQPPWHAKDRFPDFRKRVGLLRAVGETQNRILQLLNRRYVAEILPKWRKTRINQSIIIHCKGISAIT
jgi:hypothetical protein